MDILTGRILIHPTDPQRSQQFYRDTLGLGIYRSFGPQEAPSIVFFAGNGLLEVSGKAGDQPPYGVQLWFQVRDVTAEYRRLVAAGVTALRSPKTEPWGLIEAWIADPDGLSIVLVEIPADHPLRQDQRPIDTLR